MDNDTEKKDTPKTEPESSVFPENAIRTLKKESVDAMKGQQGIVIKTAIAEEKRKEEQQEQTERERKSRIAYGILGLLLILASTVAVIVAFYLKDARTIQNAGERPVSTLKFGTVYETIDITGLQKPAIVARVREKVEEPLSNNIVKTIVLTENGKAITTARFFESLAIYPPELLTREILDTSLILSVYGGEPNTLFILGRARIGTNTLRELSEWEATMVRDLADLFGISLTIQDNERLSLSSFEDVYVQNIATRAVRNTKNIPLLLYSLLNDETLIITSDIDSMVPIVDWLYAPTVRN